jgi:hypothetical protein
MRAMQAVLNEFAAVAEPCLAFVVIIQVAHFPPWVAVESAPVMKVKRALFTPMMCFKTRHISFQPLAENPVSTDAAHSAL